MFTNETDRMLADGGVMQQGGTVDPVSGNDVPPGAMQEEVRDDIDAKLSEGEFVIPADVVRYIGLSTLMKMRDKAKEGLKKMEDIGQMGNAEEVPDAEALHGGDESEEMDDESFGAEVDSILGEKEEEMPAFAEGGYVDPASEATYRDAPVRGFEMVRMVNAAGNVIYIPHTNGKPMLTVPTGYTPSLSTLPPITETPTPTTPTTSGTSGGGGNGGGDSGTPTGPSGGAGLGTSFGVSLDAQGNVTAGKSGISSGQATLGGMVVGLLTGIPALGLVASAANKAYNKAAEAEAKDLTAAMADTMGVNANTNTAAATGGVSGTGGSAASAAASAAAAAVAAGYSDDAIGAASQAAAAATIGGANATEAAAAGAAAAATVANDIDARDASAGYGAAASQGVSDPGEAASNAADAAASQGVSDPGEAASNAADAAASQGVSDPGEAASNAADAAASDNGSSFGGGEYAKGGFVQKKKNVVAKSKKGLASRK